MLRSYFSEILCHMPDRSGLPSAVRGAGALRFGLPSAVRGMPGVGYFSHWAASGVLSADKMIAKTTGFIRSLLRTTDLILRCLYREIITRFVTLDKLLLDHRNG